MDAAAAGDIDDKATMPWLYCKCGVCCALHVSEAPGSEGNLFYKCPKVRFDTKCDVNVWVSDVAVKCDVPVDATIIPPRKPGHRRLLSEGVEIASGDLLCPAEEKVLASLPGSVLRRDVAAGLKCTAGEAGLEAEVREEKALKTGGAHGLSEKVVAEGVDEADRASSVSTTFSELFEDDKLPVSEEMLGALKGLPSLFDGSTDEMHVSSDVVRLCHDLPDVVGELVKRVQKAEKRVKKRDKELRMYRAFVERVGGEEDV